MSGAPFLWDTEQYQRFGSHRLRPALDLLAWVNHSGPQHIADLGCGSGEVTRIIADRWPEAEVVGVDSSQEMLARAAATPAGVRWEHRDIRQWQPDHSLDLIYSNAALHWLADHTTLFPRLVEHLAPGGVLAVQMPLSWNEPSHRAIRETLADLGLGTPELQAELNRRPVTDAGSYVEMLAPLVAHLDVWETRYQHILAGSDPVFEWVRGTALRPVLAALTTADGARFTDTYRARLRDAYPPLATGGTVYPFPRLFMVAVR